MHPVLTAAFFDELQKIAAITSLVGKGLPTATKLNILKKEIPHVGGTWKPGMTAGQAARKATTPPPAPIRAFTHGEGSGRGPALYAARP